jgi:hypothetical protein
MSYEEAISYLKSLENSEKFSFTNCPDSPPPIDNKKSITRSLRFVSKCGATTETKMTTTQMIEKYLSYFM